MPNLTAQDQMPPLPPDVTGLPPGEPGTGIPTDPNAINTPLPPDAGATPPPMTQEEMKADIEHNLQALKQTNDAQKAQSQINTQSIADAKKMLFGELFKMLKKNGVDPNNLESIRAFITKLENQDPDFALLLEEVFNSIGNMGNTDIYPPTPTPPEPQLMDKFKNLGTNMMMPSEATTPATNPPEFAPPMESPGMPTA